MRTSPEREFSPESEEQLEVADATGIAPDLLREQDSFKPLQSWMAVEVDDVRQPDVETQTSIRWAAQRSERLLVVLEDDPALYHHLATTPPDWRGGQEHLQKLRTLAGEHRQQLETWLREEGLENVELRQWRETLDSIRQKDPGFFHHAAHYFQEARRLNPDFDQAILNASAERLPAGPAPPASAKTVTRSFIESLRVQEEVFAAWLLAQHGYPIHVGGKSETAVNRIVADVFSKRFPVAVPRSGTAFGGVTLSRPRVSETAVA